MAETAGEKTEQPTTQRIKKAREKGNVVNSQEFLSAASLVALTGAAILYGPNVTRWAMQEMSQGFSCNYIPMTSTKSFIAFFNAKIINVIFLTAPFFLILMTVGIASCLAVSGKNFSVKALAWKLENINPVNGLKNLFSATSMMKMIFSIIKLIFVGLIVYIYLRGKIHELASYQWLWSQDILRAICSLILGVVIRLCIALTIIGLADLIYQKYVYIKKLKMTKQEVKDERRNQESPPEVQRRIRQKQFELSMRRMLQDVPDANVVLVNPTHVAVALKYNPEEMTAPVVVAKGGDNMCEKIKEVARAYGVPIIRRPALARNVYAEVDLGEPIPDSLFVAVAEILALVFRLKHAR